MNSVLDSFLTKIEHIRFENIDDLYANRNEIKENYNKLDYSERQIYKWYFFYQLCILKNPLKKSAWEYINDFDNNNDFCNYYNEFLEKRKKIIDEENKIVKIRLEFD